MKQADKDALIDTIDEGLAELGPNRPSAARVKRAKTLFNEVRVACQTIPISPVIDDGGVIDPGPEDPPVDPPPIDPPPDGGGGGGETEPPPVTTVTTTYSSNGDFGSTQGFRGWYYLDSTGASTMTWAPSQSLWTGPQLYQFIWNEGAHSGPSVGVMRRWIATATGSYSITGTIRYYPDPNNLIDDSSAMPVTIKKNSTTIYTATIANDDTTGYAVSGVTGSVTIGDIFDFIVGPPSGPGTTHDNVNSIFSIALTTTTTTGGGTPTQTTLPFTLNGTPPEEGTLTITMNKPANADTCSLMVTGVDLDTTEGRIYFNGTTNSIAVWPTDATKHGVSGTVTLAVPVSYVTNGANALRFVHDAGDGYTVTAVSSSFTTIADPTPPATQTGLPLILTGSILPEDGTITTTVSKPSNATGCSMTVTGVNLTGLSGAYYVNGVLGSAIWVDNPANAGVSASVVRSPDHNLFVNGSNTIRFTHTAGSGYTVTALSVSFTTPAPTDPNPPAGNNGQFSREPAGFTALINHNYSTRTAPNLIDVFNSGQIVSDPTAPLSPPNVIAGILPAFAKEGGMQLVYFMPQIYAEMFVGFWWRCKPDFVGRIVQDKLWFMRGPVLGNAFFGLDGGPKKTGVAGAPFYVIFGHNTSGLDNSHTMSSHLGLIGTPNVATTNVFAGNWYRIEAYIKRSTTSTSRDGIVRWWLNGTLNGQYQDINYAPGGLNEWQFNSTWDGHQDMGVSNTVEWAHYLDHLYISGKN